MRIKQLLIGITASVIAISSYVELAVADLKFPMLVYRTGAYAPNGIPNADGFVDYYKMINARDGGIIGLANGGQPTMEMDYRGGGFIPVGAQERADDVPARLSKNEFVMTADAVRAAGGGSVDVGAQRMYNLMNQLEGAA